MDKYLYAVFTTHKQPEGEVAGPLVVDAGYITSNFNISEQKLRPLKPAQSLTDSWVVGFVEQRTIVVCIGYQASFWPSKKEVT